MFGQQLKCKICGGYPGHKSKPRERLYQCKDCGTLVCNQHLKTSGLGMGCPGCGSQKLKTVLGGGVGVIKARGKAKSLNDGRGGDKIKTGAGGSAGLGTGGGGTKYKQKNEGGRLDEMGPGHSAGKKFMDDLFGNKDDEPDLDDDFELEDEVEEKVFEEEPEREKILEDGDDINALTHRFQDAQANCKQVMLFENTLFDACLRLSATDSVVRASQALDNPEKDVVSIFTLEPNHLALPRFEDSLKSDLKIFGALGFGPKSTQQATSLAALNRALYKNAEQILAIGVIGLDLAYAPFTKDEQIQLLESQIRLAHLLNLPVLISQRQSEVELLEVMERIPPETKWILVSPMENEDHFKAWLSKGGMVAVTAETTLPDRKKWRNMLSSVPGPQFLLASGDDMVAPKPHAGKNNSPQYINDTLEILAEKLGTGPKNLLRLSRHNFLETFRGIQES